MMKRRNHGMNPAVLDRLSLRLCFRRGLHVDEPGAAFDQAVVPVLIELVRALVERPEDFQEDFELLIQQQQETQDAAGQAEDIAGWDATP